MPIPHSMDDQVPYPYLIALHVLPATSFGHSGKFRHSIMSIELHGNTWLLRQDKTRESED